MARVDNPEQDLQTIHVAGTNGKGSVCMTLLSILSKAGYRVGLYTSPHLSSVRERFRIGNTCINEANFARIATKIREVLGDGKITYFEFTTALAFLWFAEENVDLVVLETGLGGRLDATNIISPLVSVITNISMDHEAYLGSTISEVANEKAGIIKETIPVVSAVREGAGLFEIEKRCSVKDAPLYLFGRDFTATNTIDGSWQWNAIHKALGQVGRPLRCSMKGAYQIENASLAVATLQLLQKQGYQIGGNAIQEGMAAVHWPGRLESFSINRQGDKKKYLLDGAHNPAGVESLVQCITEECDYTKLIFIWGAMADKDLQTTLATVINLADIMILTKPKGERSADPALLLENVKADCKEKCKLLPKVEDAIAWAEGVAGEGDLIVVAGSLYLVGAARTILLGELVV